ncbi:sulfurtransferase [Rhodococcus sp. ARC_M6]|uniref:sulfurtransferase n=1 Tax=Rhodococcus sp. ARC_M6 TaxID=2928852 RepID=UPI001FB2C0B3|nr:sulfurtransferase [Rhodococcus sp. ARC_M6]MCJ0906564.1 sulfurtransferase [Rhodococcus sp. ARC_M6]
MTLPVLIDAPELASLIDAGTPPVLLDVRWALGDPNGEEHFRDAHIPGAVFVNLETELAAPASKESGRHPLPSIQDLQKAGRRWGINDGDTVVLYDAVGNMSAARGWWLLRWAGLADVRLLDGGLPNWESAGLPTSSGSGEVVAAGTVTLRGGNMPTVDINDVAGWNGVLLDARAGERYRGEVEPIDPVAGHIPGAVSAPTVENLDGSGRFSEAKILRERFARLGGTDSVAVYCGSGVTAAHQIAALAIAGYDATLFPGSWSQWSNDSARAVETGA